MKRKDEIVESISDLIKEYVEIDTLENNLEYKQGERIPYASVVRDETEILNAFDCIINTNFCAGKYTQEFEKKFAEYLGVKNAYIVNSGSSANLLAFMSLTAPQLGDRAIKRGDEVITVACGFPTTISPIIQYGAIPVFVDVTIPGYNINVDEMKKALSNKTKAVMIAHTLGIPFDLIEVSNFCKENNLWLIEDNCDALGAEVLIDGKYVKTGSVGDIGTSSFYPPHHMTMGEGGAVYTNNPILSKILLSLRDWGRDCVCPPGIDNLCKRRFEKQYGDLPLGYDHKFVYSNFGYNLKATDMQAAIGVAQLEKINNFVKKRNINFGLLTKGLEEVDEYFYFTKNIEDVKFSPFGFVLTIKDDVKINRNELISFIENRGIQTRTLFAGNILRQPCFFSNKDSIEYRVCSDLKNTDYIMNNTFWIGVSPRITKEEIEWMILSIKEGVDTQIKSDKE